VRAAGLEPERYYLPLKPSPARLSAGKKDLHFGDKFVNIAGDENYETDIVV
jgi:hypothetical protein